MSKTKPSHSAPPKLSTRHDCDLPQSAREGEQPSPYAGRRRKWCFTFQNFFTIYKNTESLQYFRSNASMIKERKRHVSNRNYRYIIHPFSKFVMRKRVILFVVWYATLMLDPFLGTFRQDDYFTHGLHPATLVFYTIMQILLAMDMISRFFTGFIIRKTREIVLEPRRIAKNYFSGFFWVDFIPFIPTIIWILNPHMPRGFSVAIYQLRMVRLFRIRSIIRNSDVTGRLLGVSEPIRISFHITLVGVLNMHLWTCVSYLLPTLQRHFDDLNTLGWLSFLKRKSEQIDIGGHVMSGYSRPNIFFDYLQHAFLIICHYFGAGYRMFKVNRPIEMLTLASVSINGLCFYIYTFARIMQIFGVVNIAESKYEELVTQAGTYMLAMKFPTDLKKRVNKYYDYKYDKTFFSEQKILLSLSEHLRLEVLLYSCRNLVEKVQLFRGLSKSAVGCILALLKQEIYLSGDVIMTSSDDSGTLYFILYGTCSVQLLGGKEAMHIEDGNHFGEFKRITYGSYNGRDILYTVTAAESCEIYSLKSKDITFCCRSYPEITAKLENMSKAKEKYYRTVLAMAEVEEEIKAMDIIDELRRGKILQHGRHRDVLNLT